MNCPTLTLSALSPGPASAPEPPAVTAAPDPVTCAVTTLHRLDQSTDNINLEYV